MSRNFLPAFVFLWLVLFFCACKHERLQSLPANNYLLRWHSDSGYLLLQNYRADTTGRPSTRYTKNDELLTATIGGTLSYSLIKTPDSLYLANQFGHLPSMEVGFSHFKMFPAFWDRPFKKDTGDIAAMQNSLGSDTLKELKLQNIQAKQAGLYALKGISVEIANSEIDYLALSGYFAGVYQPLKFAITTQGEQVIGRIDISYRKLQEITVNEPIRKLVIRHSEVDHLASINGFTAPDTLELDSINFTNLNARLELKGLGDLKANRHQPVVLICDHTDITKIQLDYTQFNLLPLSEYHHRVQDNQLYSYDKQQYAQLLAGQQADYNQGGIVKASVDAAQFEDAASGLADCWIWVKLEWNNYGYTKYLVIPNTFRLFCLFSLLNLFLFKWLPATYEIQEINNAWQAAAHRNHWARRLLWFVYGLLYTGYIFFGLRLEVKELKLNNLLLALLVIIEYVTGIICLGYIANLIIAK